MTKTLNDPSVFTLRVWETLSTICQEIFLRATQMIYIVAKSRLRRDENGSTLQFWDILVIKTLLLNLILMLVLIKSPTTALTEFRNDFRNNPRAELRQKEKHSHKMSFE